MVQGVTIRPKAPEVTEITESPNEAEKRVGKVGVWLKENKDKILIGIATAGLLMQAIRIFKN